jgi:tetratricopeptide (TPR) repeat protein
LAIKGRFGKALGFRLGHSSSAKPAKEKRGKVRREPSLTDFIMPEASSFPEASEGERAVRAEDRPEERSLFAEVSEDKPEVAPRWESLEAGIAEGKALLEEGDVAGAVALWEQVSEAFPESVAAFQGPVSFLVQAKRFAEARGLLGRGLERFPGDRRLMIDLAWTLHHLKAWPEALEAWGALSRAHPTEWLGILGGAATLRQLKRFDEAEALLLEGREQLGEHPACEVDLAWVATERKDWAVAIERWEGVREKRPDEAVGYLGGALALRESKQFDEAEAVLRAARERFPEHRQVLMDLGHLAIMRRDFAGAVEIWQEVRTQFPEHVEGYIWGAFALRELQQLDAAEELARAGLQRHHVHPHLLADFARLAQSRGNWLEALRRWEAAVRSMPKAMEPQVGCAGALRELQRFDEAESLLTRAREQFPDQPQPLVELAITKHRRGDVKSAAPLWQEVRRRFPQNVVGYIWGAVGLRELQQFEAAEELLRAGLERHPAHPHLLGDFARLAHFRGHWAEALRRWEAAEAAAPGRLEPQLGRVEALKRLRQFDAALSNLRELGPLS